LIGGESNRLQNVPMAQTPIEVILFDLGNVILPFDHHQMGEKLLQFSLKKETEDPRKIFAYLFDLHTGAVNLYETGKMSSLEFFQSLKDFFHLQISFDEFTTIWNDIFTENEDVSNIIRSLKGKKKLGLVSNTNSLHFDYIASRFPVVRSFDRWILSHEVGFKKPSPEIYQRAIEWASVEPPTILFIDDMQRNVEAAVSLGIQAIRFVSTQQLQEELSLRLNSQG
jgi:HAD superfamily hydrolase (TIGR01509 family)